MESENAPVIAPLEVEMFKKQALVLIVAALVFGVGAYAWAEGAPPRPTAAAQPGSGQHWSRGAGRDGRGAHRFGPLQRAIHGDVTVRRQGGAGFEQVTFDRGEVTAASASSITVKRPDGVSVTKAINGDTKFRGVQSAGDIKTGKPALVVSKGGTATMIGQPNRDRQGQAPRSSQ